jgi:serine/threonine protein kinase
LFPKEHFSICEFGNGILKYLDFDGGKTSLNITDKTLVKINEFSPHLLDFLLQCFNKDSRFRITAREALMHELFGGPGIPRRQTMSLYKTMPSTADTLLYTVDELRFYSGFLQYRHEMIRNIVNIPIKPTPRDNESKEKLRKLLLIHKYDKMDEAFNFVIEYAEKTTHRPFFYCIFFSDDEYKKDLYVGNELIDTLTRSMKRISETRLISISSCIIYILLLYYEFNIVISDCYPAMKVKLYNNIIDLYLAEREERLLKDILLDAIKMGVCFYPGMDEQVASDFEKFIF